MPAGRAAGPLLTDATTIVLVVAVALLLAVVATVLALPAWRRARRRGRAPQPRTTPDGGVPPRAAVVYNPNRVDFAAFRARVEAYLQVHGWAEPVWLPTTADDPGVGMCEHAVAAGVDLVFVCGGDGTIMAAATALAGSGVPMAVVPVGTGNLLARNLEIPLNDEQEALRIGVFGRTAAIDVGNVEGRRFVVMAGLGFDAAMVRDAPEGLKRTLGWPAYVVSGARHLRGRGIKVAICLDDDPPLRRRVRTVVVGNVGRLQVGIPLLPDARPDDGILDVVVIAPRTVVDWARVSGRVVRRRNVPDRRMERFRAKRVRIEASRPEARQLDGDVIEDSRTMEIVIEPKALLVKLP
jgi:YegS/Rv2252/BmrU family lipid kinase